MSLQKGFAKWKEETGIHGAQAFNKYIMLLFVEDLSKKHGDKYIFKGGNLLWFYIKTPRPTTDIDFATDHASTLEQVIEDFKTIKIDEVVLTILKSEKIDKAEKTGVSLQVGFKTSSGAENSFGIDIVFAIQTHRNLIKINNKDVSAASMENIIVDKIAATKKWIGGNTRLKDYDDLYRIAKSDAKIDGETLRKISEQRGIELKLHGISQNEKMQELWKAYMSKKQYKESKDLPSELSEVVDFVNRFLKKL